MLLEQQLSAVRAGVQAPMLLTPQSPPHGPSSNKATHLNPLQIVLLTGD